jgi:hypothetical protein
MCHIFSWSFFTLIILNILSKDTLAAITTLSPLKSSNIKPSITQFLVFSSSSETVIPFEPKNGWMLSEEKKLRLYISGSNIKDNSIVFTGSPNECTSSDFISPIYHLSSASIIELNIKLKSVSQSHSSIYLCLLPSVRSKINKTQSENGTLLVGPYFTFIREKSTIPFAAKICLILMLFMVSGFFR